MVICVKLGGNLDVRYLLFGSGELWMGGWVSGS